MQHKASMRRAQIRHTNSPEKREKTTSIFHVADDFVIDPNRSESYFIASEEIASKAVAAVKRKIDRIIKESSTL